MALTKLTAVLSYIAALGDNPITDNNLTAQQLKVKFDQASLDIQDYINNTLTEELDSAIRVIKIGSVTPTYGTGANQIQNGEIYLKYT